MNQSSRPFYWMALSLIGVVIAAYILFPIFWLVLASFKTTGELASLPLTFWPQAPTIEAYTALFDETSQSSQLLNWPTLISNSFIVAVSSTILVVFFGTLAGYAFSRLHFPGRDLILGGLLISRMFQGAALLLPTYRLMNSLNLQDSLLGLILLYSAFGLPFATWIIASSLREIPFELEESAMMDGASRLQSMVRIVLPLATPALITAAMWHFVGAWSEFAFASILMESSDNKTVTIGLASFVELFTIEFNRVGAAATLVAMPIMVVFFFGQRYFTRGLLAGAVKG
ncbi:carbohydrate ABC transporter permease [Yoonia sediminilitoris]|uniref:Maltose/maltodextrin transport system permease protein MalG n=1 Tax=Yoonia sediminilitoris TaxID=1286148 RepID=A0A2T6K4J7_9RHOB|nr:carbohydrate ABC transporter permease [Yoonia sediminilitoris]PUB09545.1 carbohydrate ABC transporter membrane protein 2 (CUT1 family) [Yoonia sediminilitoris]RCW89500.1 carbohydrate ABC transporter membrane protein 2 (CUT1 family) [Yoonia sediminilitoris]